MPKDGTVCATHEAEKTRTAKAAVRATHLLAVDMLIGDVPEFILLRA